MRFPARSAAMLTALVALVLSGVTALPATAASRPASHPGAHSALRLARLSTIGSELGSTAGQAPLDATMLARDAVLHPEQIAPRARKQAQAYGERPDYLADGEASSALCSTTVPICVHYATTGTDAPRGAINPTLVLNTLTHVYQTYAASGYRMPEPDSTAGPHPIGVPPTDVDYVDIYLANIGSAGVYGYCSPERVANSTVHHTPAFCVLDNDYAEFSSGTPLTNLEVTAAHEFFHAVQFGYDATEDQWFMESTAVWVEDEVYDAINDNTQYLRSGPMGKPAQSLDKSTSFGVYGGWSFFRWVTEHRPQLKGQMPAIILSMWQRAAANTTGKDRYSLQAVASALKAAGLPLTTAFAKFAAANRDPAHTYSEGAANHYPLAKPTKTYRLHTTRRTTGKARIDHLAAATERFVPQGRALKGKHTKLHLTLDMAQKSHGSGAVVTVFLRKGGTKVKMIHLSKSGKGAVSVPFSKKLVKRVELTMVNASTRMTCWVGGLYSCRGEPKDMNQLERFTAQPRRH